jgi:hypothetical protein
MVSGKLFCSLKGLKDDGIRVLVTSFYRKKLISLTLVGTSGMDVRAVLSSFTEDKVTSTLLGNSTRKSQF